MIEPRPEDFERARAAVAASCLRWLRCTGEGTSAIEPFRHDPLAVRRFLATDPPLVPIRELPAMPVPDPHPLWDRWLDA